MMTTTIKIGGTRKEVLLTPCCRVDIGFYPKTKNHPTFPWLGKHKHYCPSPITKLIEVVLTAVGPLLIIGDNVVVSLRLEPVADAERALDAADEVGVLVGVFTGLVEHPDDLLAA
jgi:hypothetical protein